VTLRRALGDHVRRLHAQVEDLLDREDGFIVLVDADRAISYMQGFGASPCQLELLAAEIERTIRHVLRARCTLRRIHRRRSRDADKERTRIPGGIRHGSGPRRLVSGE